MGDSGETGVVRILSLEDDPDDEALLRHQLARSGLRHSLRWVRTAEEFALALKGFDPHVVLSDYRMPAYDGLAALALVRETSPDLPFILISGTIGEERAVEALKSGATDYVLKDRLARLEPVLNRALSERRERERRRAAEVELGESQRRLLHSQKMEALGRLSGGVAHDFNNILTAITGYGEFMLADPRLPEALRDDARGIVDSAFRAAALTGQLLAFSRRQAFAPQVLDLNRVLAEFARMLRRIIGDDVELSVAPAEGLWRVRADADRIGQVIMNLAVNARDAMPGGGRLSLRTANVELTEADSARHPEGRPGRFVRLTVEDDGTGMDAETLARIFEPFFTTKSKDKGTGLGLATVYGIVKQSSGFIEVASRPGAGSAFEVHLPVADGDFEAERRPDAPATLRGDETVLIVDDDAAVARVARRVLEAQGYAVIEARGGEEALALTGPVDLLVCDILMAQMSGPELARRFRLARPDCRVLFISGYADGAPEASEPFLAKPFTAETLARKVREALESPPGT